MEAFEKKWEDWDCTVDCYVEKGCDRCEKIAKYWYRAALEWMKQEAIRLNGEEGYHLIDVFKLVKVIEKELEDRDGSV